MKISQPRNALSKTLLHSLGVVTWHERKPENQAPFANASTSNQNQSATEINTPDRVTLLAQLGKQVSACTRCALCQTRTQTVLGDGDPQAKLMLIGEAPGFHEDQQGIPFVGEAGQLLNKILNAIELTRSQVYIANILKCRPPENRDPHASEVEQCTPYLIQQIQIIQPKLIVALGRIAAHYLLQNKQSLETQRGSALHSPILNTPIFVTYHPAYLLRNPDEKGKAWQDWKNIRDALKRES